MKVFLICFSLLILFVCSCDAWAPTLIYNHSGCNMYCTPCGYYRADPPSYYVPLEEYFLSQRGEINLVKNDSYYYCLFHPTNKFVLFLDTEALVYYFPFTLPDRYYFKIDEEADAEGFASYRLDSDYRLRLCNLYTLEDINITPEDRDEFYIPFDYDLPIARIPLSPTFKISDCKINDPPSEDDSDYRFSDAYFNHRINCIKKTRTDTAMKIKMTPGRPPGRWPLLEKMDRLMFRCGLVNKQYAERLKLESDSLKNNGVQHK